jgi:hypothetical protein
MKDQAGKFLTKGIRKRVVGILSGTAWKINRKLSPKAPIVEFENRHVENAKLLANRNALLKVLPKNGVVAEIGVDEGDFSEMILECCNPRNLHLVDFWGSERCNQD